MAEISWFDVMVFFRTVSPDQSYSERSLKLEIEASDLADADARFFAAYVSDGRYKIQVGGTLYILEPPHITRIEIRKQTAGGSR